MRKLLLAGALLIFLFSCRHEIPLSNNTGGGNGGSGSGGVVVSTCSTDTVYFTNTILPLITSSCAQSGCHDPVRHEENLVLNSYSGIMQIVRAGNPSQSKLYQVITTTNPGDIMPRPPNPPLSPTAVAAIQKWIAQGAKNNQCNGCDTAQFTFSNAIAPLINTYCKGCHNPASLGGGMDLSNYNGIRSTAATGKLLGSIKQLSGYKPMPQNGSRLSDCQIRQVEKWIQAGMLNN